MVGGLKNKFPICVDKHLFSGKVLLSFNALQSLSLVHQFPFELIQGFSTIYLFLKGDSFLTLYCPRGLSLTSKILWR